MSVGPKLKIKYPVPGPRPCQFGKQVSVLKDQGDNYSVNSNRELGIEKAQKCLGGSVGGKKFLAAGDSRETSSKNGAKKRGTEELMDHSQGKRQKMDRAMTFQCSTVLKHLMTNRYFCLFSKPVDPVALKIPDYFSIITNPMDLGTVKSKLDKNTYLSIEDFAADIRLTFANAMLYNPPGNKVHQIAKELSDQFEVRWKSVEGKLKGEKIKVAEGKVSSMQMKGNEELRQNCPKTPPLHGNTLPKRSKVSGEMVKKLEFDAKLDHHKPVQTCTSKFLGKKLSKGTNSGGEYARVSINTKTESAPGASKCCTCGSIRCQCSLIGDSNHASSSDITSERSISGDHRSCTTDASHLDPLAKGTSTSQMSKSDPDSDGAISAFDDGNTCLSSELKIHASDGVVSDGLIAPIVDVQMSPSKALRAAMLKSRFADTILKAKQKTLLDHGDKADPVKIQQEKERLERRQREAKAKIEAQIRAAEAAAQLRAEMESKKKREREREAARIALQKIQKTVEFEQNLETLKELEILSGCSLPSYRLYHRDGSHQMVWGAFEGSGIANPLQLQDLGLFIKDDYQYLDEEDEAVNLDEDGEEGEIIS
ncbi:hypothetical protein SLEP1_g6178 [Rubroshorea leprosula]|uniref:Bromo domain-containing protein n=1 Tax=Rubroshorea leprosula TaxID=152421 RepID=A0AAV5HYT5_9ROSI|nr:hypothetical protein SLEP1_g6178 [Rubroshorea leprosula]